MLHVLDRSEAGGGRASASRGAHANTGTANYRVGSWLAGAYHSSPNPILVITPSNISASML